jgi:lipopolysaccharide transport system ATP-binding protein
VVSKYLSSELGTSAERRWTLSNAPGNDVVKLLRVRVVDHQGQTAEAVDIRRKVGVEMTYQVFTGGSVLIPNLHFYNEEGDLVFILQDTTSEWRSATREAGTYASTVWIPGNMLSEGTLVVGAAVSTHLPLNIHLFERDAVAFQVKDTLDGDSVRGDYAGLYPGAVRPAFPWSTEQLP